MTKRNPYQTGKPYHIMNLSIAGYVVFHKPAEFERFIQSMRYNQYDDIDEPFSHFVESFQVQKNGLSYALHKKFQNATRKIDIHAYCLMSTHFHIICRQNRDGGLLQFLNQTMSGYVQYFNHRHHRKGPLWIARTKKVDIQNEDHLSVATRYVHLNPTTAYLVEKPEEWPYTSYHEYIHKRKREDCFCQKFMQEKNWQDYKKSIEERIRYQRELTMMKKLL